MVNNQGLRLVKIRVVQDRIPELGDKFCLTDDHDVLTNTGWKSIKDVTLDDKVLQRNKETGKGEWVNPIETFIFNNTENEMLYDFNSEHRRLIVTGGHRLWTNNGFIKASDVSDTIIMGDDTTNESFILNKYYKECKVYCISVPSEVFMVRYQNKEPVWTGNSNRHGQKGTIGALLRAQDMPRTESGIVPDMIMNPHAIPSRMTIAQNLEQLLGKTAALSGGIGDGTSFMNDGSPQEAIGGILEQFGFEKYGNEVMYNGATGEQIPTAIFIGPVYGMRLKHMVEDKWNARGQGRREQLTHQPTGGRGAQGGLKIGEMDRDAIIAHGGMSFVKESFMERSDGATIPLCVACGMIPIFNPRLNLAICQMCDGPVKYMGDNVNNLEILPPLGRPKSKIVQVEMPYSTKLLTHEQETYLNLAMRYMTTSGFQRLTPFEFSGKSSEIVNELQPMAVPPIPVPAYVEDVQKKVLSVEQLNSMNAHVEGLSAEERARVDAIQDLDAESNEEQMEQMGQMNAMAALQPLPVAGLAADGLAVDELPVDGQIIGPTANPQNQIIYPTYGGLQIPALEGTAEGVIGGSAIPGAGPMIAVRTDRDAFESDGIYLEGGNRPIRRNMYRNQMPQMPQMQQMGTTMGTPMGAVMERFSPMAGGQGSPPSGQTVTVNKLE